MKNLKDFLEEFNNFTYEEIEDLFEGELDACYEPVNLAGMTIYASDMKSIDPVMFRCGVADYSSEYFTEYKGLYYKIEEFDQATELYEEYLEEEA